MSDANAINPLLNGLNGLQTGGADQAKKKKDDKAIGQDEFLTMLVAQLKNQDPLNPMQNEEFAVNLAQFSQLERLISIDQKLGKSDGDVSSYAAYLGREVTLNSTKVAVDGGDGGKAALELVARANNVKVELVNASGTVAKSIDVGTLEAGRHQVPLNNLAVPNGEYTLRVTAQGASGAPFSVKSSPVVLVTGFVPGATPTLLAGEREISPADITRVNAPA